MKAASSLTDEEGLSGRSPALRELQSLAVQYWSSAEISSLLTSFHCGAAACLICKSGHPCPPPRVRETRIPLWNPRVAPLNVIASGGPWVGGMMNNEGVRAAMSNVAPSPQQHQN